MNPQNQQDPVNQPVQPSAAPPPPTVQVPVNVQPAPAIQPTPAPVQPNLAANPVSPPPQSTVQPPTPTQVQPSPPVPPMPPQSTGFAPSGFQQANFIQQGFQPGDIKQHKKSLLNSKLFIFVSALIMFALVIGGWFAYTRLWVVDRTPALISFSNANRALYKAIGGVSERQYTNLSFLSEDYSADIDKTRDEKLEPVFEKLDELIAKNDQEVSKFNSLRDPEFAKLISAYSTDVKRCSVYVKDLNTDINSFGAPLESLRKATEPVGSGSKFSESSVATKRKLLKAVKADYKNVVDSMKTLNLKTEQVKKIRDSYVKKIEDTSVDDLISELNDPSQAAFVSAYKIIDFYDVNKEGMNEINHNLDKGTCHSEAKEELNEIFGEHDFDEKDKDLMESVELF